MAISTATVKAYIDTGFDANNIPDSPSLLQSAAARVVTLDTLNCLPLDGNSGGSITVKAFADLPKTDYLSLYFPQDGITYYVTGLEYQYVSLDTVVITFVIDGWLTAGGLANISKVSGLTKRHHVTDDTFGNYTMPDEMMIPSKPLKCASTDFKHCEPLVGNVYKIVVATIDLFRLGEVDANGDYVWAADAGIDYTSDENVCCVPIVPNITEDMECTIDIGGFASHTYAVKTPGLCYFNGANETVQRGIAMARSLGIESAILYQYIIPNAYIDRVDYYASQSGTNYGTSIFSKIYTASFGENPSHPSEVGLIYDTVMNNRVLCGNLNAYTLVSIATGESISMNPEDWDTDVNAQQLPMFGAFDPRPTGKPIYKPLLKNTPSETFISSVRGEQWASAPITYENASAIDLTIQKFNNNRDLAKGEFEMDQMMNYVNAAAGVFGGGYSSAANSRGGQYLGTGVVGGNGKAGTHPYKFDNVLQTAPGGMSSSIPFVSGAVNLGATVVGNEMGKARFAMERANEKANFYMDNIIVAPQLNFPRSETVRDIVGNGYMIWRTYLDPDDVDRLDVILNMYGYKDIKKLEKSDFTNRQYYNYVEAGDVKITYTNAVCKRVREIAQRQVEAGIRIWHRRCDTALFNQVNPVTT